MPASKDLLPQKIEKIINDLLSGKTQKSTAFDNCVARNDIYIIKKSYPLFLGWTNKYGKED